MQIQPAFFQDHGVKVVFDVFAKNGQATSVRAVGGCVRNVLMGIPINDVDFATTMVPTEVAKMFEAAGHEVIPTGIDHGTVSVLVRQAGQKTEAYEITTLRRDVETDGRHAVIEYTDDWQEDAMRRDFTFNAMYVDSEGEVYDYFNGIDATEHKVLVFVGNAEDRIREDYLRILRMYRFISALGAHPDSAALEASMKLRAGIKTLSVERIQKELFKTLTGARGDMAISLMSSAGILDVLQIVGNISAFMDLHKVRRDDPILLLATLMSNSAYNDPHVFASKWRLSNEDRFALVGALNTTADMQWDVGEIERRSHFDSHMANKLWVAWANSDVPKSQLDALLKGVKGEHPFPLDGRDLIAKGMKPGPMFGKVLKGVEKWWVDNDFPDRDACLTKMNEMIEKVS
jgi:poly(A) polymerase